MNRLLRSAQRLRRAAAALLILAFMDMPTVAPAALPHAGRRFAAFLFDMDGTLITSIDSANRAWTRWSERRGFDPAYVISIMHGVRTVETMKRLGVDDPEAEAAWITRTCAMAESSEISSRRTRVSYPFALSRITTIV